MPVSSSTVASSKDVNLVKEEFTTLFGLSLARTSLYRSCNRKAARTPHVRVEGYFNPVQLTGSTSGGVLEGAVGLDCKRLSALVVRKI